MRHPYRRYSASAKLAGITVSVVLALGAFLLGAAPSAMHRSHNLAPSTATAYGRLPLSFEPNRGQAPPDVRYVAHGAGYTVALTNRGVLLRLASKKRGSGGEVGIRLVGGSLPLALQAHQRLIGKVNYMIGKDRSRWQTGIPTFASVLAPRVWPGVDVAFNGDQRRLEYSFRLAPGADPARIRLAFPGARYVRLDRSALALGVAGSVVRQPQPTAYQLVRGTRHAISARYTVSHGRAGVALGRYDRHLPLVIDPSMDYSTFLGGSNGESCGSDIGRPAGGACVAVNSTRHAYITGITVSTDFPTANPYQPNNGGNTGNAFVSKFTPDGSGLEYSTYLGGPTPGGYVWNRSIAVDSSGAAYITGSTNETDFPTTPGAYKTTGCCSAYVSKLSPDGSNLDYSTRLSDSIPMDGNAIAVDSTGHAIVGGWAGLAGNNQAFVGRVSADGSAFGASFFGGVSSNNDYVYALALDSSNNVYATGTTDSTDFPTTPGAFQPSDPSPTPGHSSGFVMKLDSAGTTVWSTYLAGNAFDEGKAIAVGSSRDVYVTGSTQSTTFPTTPGAYQTSRPGTASSAFVTKLNPDGSAPVYSTYLAGNSFEVGNGIAVDSSGRAIVAGETSSGDFPTTAGAVQRTLSAFSGFLTALNPQGSGVAYSTYLGNAGSTGVGVALDSSGGVYLGGEAQEQFGGGVPTTPGAFQTSPGGGTDAFLTKFHPAVVLSVGTGGFGSGTVTGSPGSVNCGGSCSQEFNLNDNVPVTLTATPASGSTFPGWSGACSGTGPCIVTMSADRSVTATFTASSTPPQQPQVTRSTPPQQPQVTRLKLSPSKFRAAGHGGSVARAKKPKKKLSIGATVSYSDSQAATTTFTVKRATTGIKRGKNCVQRTKKNRRGEKCTRWVPVNGHFSHTDRAGANSFKFSGRLSGKALSPGAYRLDAQPTLGTLTGESIWAAFTIVR